MEVYLCYCFHCRGCRGCRGRGEKMSDCCPGLWQKNSRSWMSIEELLKGMFRVCRNERGADTEYKYRPADLTCSLRNAHCLQIQHNALQGCSSPPGETAINFRTAICSNTAPKSELDNAVHFKTAHRGVSGFGVVAIEARFTASGRRQMTEREPILK